MPRYEKGAEVFPFGEVGKTPVGDDALRERRLAQIATMGERIPAEPDFQIIFKAELGD